DPGRRRDLARERIEGARAPLAPPRRLGLVADARRQVAGEHGDEQEDEERQQVLRLGHRQREYRIDEEEVVDQEPEEGREKGGAEATPDGAHGAGGEGTT